MEIGPLAVRVVGARGGGRAAAGPAEYVTACRSESRGRVLRSIRPWIQHSAANGSGRRPESVHLAQSVPARLALDDRDPSTVRLTKVIVIATS
jgi:hypothetical protein